MTSLLEWLQGLQFGRRDAVDVLLAAVVLYQILLLIRGARAVQMAIGLMFLGAAQFGAQYFKLVALERLTASILFYLPFALIVLFQFEIRRGLSRLGRNPFIAFLSRRGEETPLAVIAAASESLASQRIGALMAIERTQDLRGYTEAGKLLDARLSAELLLNIFAPNTPLHDGAVIIQGGRIVAAGTFLPLSISGKLSQAHGTRHRAALGLSEETDAVVVVISEENGSIGLAAGGTFEEDLDAGQLTERLTHHLQLARKRGG